MTQCDFYVTAAPVRSPGGLFGVKLAITKFLGVTANKLQVLGVTATKSHLPEIGSSLQRRTQKSPNRQRTTSSNLVSLRYEKSFPPSTPSWFILTSSSLLDNILPRTTGFTGVKDVASFRRILLNKREDERRRLAY